MYNVVATSPAPDGRRSSTPTRCTSARGRDEPAPDSASPRARRPLRAPWFDVSCCPTNVARTFASLSAYVATTSTEGVQLHQYLPSEIATSLGDGRRIGLRVATDYPAEGRVGVQVTEAPDGPVELALRIPAWSVGRATLDGEPVEGAVARVRRTFQTGDVVELGLDVAARVTSADQRVDAVRGCVAVERGPLVMCVESTDLPAGVEVDAVRLDPHAPLVEDADGLAASGALVDLTDSSWPYGAAAAVDAPAAPFRLALRPYYDWGNRGPSTMRVWIPTT